MGHAQHVDMLHGPLLGKIILFALPIAMSSILQQLFISANVAVVGHFVGAQAVAAVAETDLSSISSSTSFSGFPSAQTSSSPATSAERISRPASPPFTRSWPCPY